MYGLPRLSKKDYKKYNEKKSKKGKRKRKKMPKRVISSNKNLTQWNLNPLVVLLHKDFVIVTTQVFLPTKITHFEILVINFDRIW